MQMEKKSDKRKVIRQRDEGKKGLEKIKRKWKGER